ncbi:MAG: CHAT domain-containing protein [Roseiflexaceae bacterium]
MFKDYALFDIRIRGIDLEHSTIEVHSELGGDAQAAFISPTTVAAYPEYIACLQRLDTDEDMLVELGQILFSTIFSSRVKDVYTRSQGKLASDQGLRLRFDIDPALSAITAMPWEFLYDPDQGPLTMLDAPIVRYLSQQSPPPVLKASLPLKVLVTGAITPPAPDVNRELIEVRAALADLEQTGQVSIQVEEHLTRTKLQRLVRSGFHIWHFIGHGALSRDGSSGTLLFEDASGSPDAVSARELGIFLNRSGLQLIVLDACGSAQLMTDPYRSIAPALIRAQVPAVVAMQFKVPQDATRAFAGEFYRTLAEGFPLDACVTEGRKAVLGISGLRSPDWGIPVVYTRAPDGKLFDLPTAAVSATPAANSGTNVSIGSGNVVQDASSINISNVGNTTVQEQERASDIEALRELIRTNRRRLNQRQLQAAKYGIGVDPSISIEIEDLTKEIAKLESELKALGG